MKVSKFGGSSLATAESVGRVCDIVASDPKRRIVVVSAPGKRSGNDVKITDLLIECARQRLAGKPADDVLSSIVGRYADIQKGMGLPDSVVATIADDLKSRINSDVSHETRFIDQLKAAGEDNCARLFAEALRSRGTDARYVNPQKAGMLLTSEFGNARILPEAYDKLSELKRAKGVTVFPGFFGYTSEGWLVTFPRGGSDITGSVLAAAVGAELYENFTDVDSVFAADPRIVKNARPIPEITYREMRELAYAGFEVLHEEAIVPLVKRGIPICVKNTHRPSAPGTMIVPAREVNRAEVVGIASDEGFCSILVGKYLMNREVGFGRRLLQILEDEGLSYEHAPSGIDNMSVILREDRFDSGTEARVVAKIKDQLAVEDVSVERGLALVMIVGEGMKYTVGMAAKATRAFSDARVNIEMINQGSSEISIMFGVKSEDRAKAVNSLYRAFFE